MSKSRASSPDLALELRPALPKRALCGFGETRRPRTRLLTFAPLRPVASREDHQCGPPAWSAKLVVIFSPANRAFPRPRTEQRHSDDPFSKHTIGALISPLARTRQPCGVSFQAVTAHRNRQPTRRRCQVGRHENVALIRYGVADESNRRDSPKQDRDEQPTLNGGLSRSISHVGLSGSKTIHETGWFVRHRGRAIKLSSIRSCSQPSRARISPFDARCRQVEACGNTWSTGSSVSALDVLEV
jgi:hypothetical protein